MEKSTSSKSGTKNLLHAILEKDQIQNQILKLYAK